MYVFIYSYLLKMIIRSILRLRSIFFIYFFFKSVPSTLQVGTWSGHSQRQRVGCQANPSGHLKLCSTPSTQLTKSPQLLSDPVLNMPHFRAQFPDDAAAAVIKSDAQHNHLNN